MLLVFYLVFIEWVDMKSIVFVDTEIEPYSAKILDIGSIKDDGSTFHSNSISGFINFLQGSEYICGHNFLCHDLKYIQNAVSDANVSSSRFIDTLYLSPLLFPAKPYHALLKDDKLQTDDINNPLNDSIKARDLFNDEVSAFKQLDNEMKKILYTLLKDRAGFTAFFAYISYRKEEKNIEKVIRNKFYSMICENADLSKMISEHPIELSFCLALINTKDRYSITPPWVLKNYPLVRKLMYLLRNSPCHKDCVYCNEAFDIQKGLKRFFGFDSFKTYADEPLQENAVRAAVSNKSLLAVFPTGGGKSVTFQVPALMSGVNTRGLTVVISPLQSLMKDQVDNLEKINITDAVTINGMLDIIERAKSIERVKNGSASILYISPESLRSKTIEHLLLGRNVVRFVIDEAHCFSSWGQDFRVDYLYIGDFIRSYQEMKNLEFPIPVSCFTATAKLQVIEDIRKYFKDKLDLDLELFSSSASRTNLHYLVYEKNNENDKYTAIRELLDEKNCPTIIYVSRTRAAYLLAKRLTDDGYPARPFHGKMSKLEKIENQDAFIKGKIQIMVATSAFGMGVDKKDVGMVIHFDISDSLENYVQEAGRAGRDENISADCFVLFNDDDLSKHFILLNQTKLNIQEIQQIWNAIKDITKIRSKISRSALEIARKAGWNDSIVEIETRVTTAIAALEEAGYLKRSHNMPKIYADGILSKNAFEAINKINSSSRFDENEKKNAVRIIKKLISCKSRSRSSDDEAESRVDYISDQLAIPKSEVIHIVNLLREEKILADTKDLQAFIKKKEKVNISLNTLKAYRQIENHLINTFTMYEKTYHIKELNSSAEENGCMDVTPAMLRTIINYWSIKNWIKRQTTVYSKNHISISSFYTRRDLETKIELRHDLARFIIEYLYEKSDNLDEKDIAFKNAVLIEFSIIELMEAYKERLTLIDSKITINDIEDALFYLSKIEALRIEGGFLVTYNAMTIERIEQDNKKRYKVEDYQKLNRFYENKVQQIHIVGEYAKKMISDYKDALQFVDDYFKLNYSSFIKKYFKGSRKNEIKRNITPAKFKQLFGELSPTQLNIIKDNRSKYIVVAAGPGSGKTRVLVHKLASLLLMEDVKHEQLLMITFSRASATEFKKRLLKLIGNAANFIEIKTFHSYCFDLLGRIGTLEKSDIVIREAIDKIKNNEIEPSRITKAVLVIDEAQDMDADEYELISTLITKNEDMRVIAVGDDDQNIFEFRGSSSKYMIRLIEDKKAVVHELIDNYRSKKNLVDFSNQFAKKISDRLKKSPVQSVQGDNGLIKLVRYKSSNLVVPLISRILTEELFGSTCVLTKTNEEAMQITGLLINEEVQARLIQSNEDFDIYNLIEVRFFINLLKSIKDMCIISDEIWSNARRKLVEVFDKSSDLEICINIINDFETTNPRYKYISDFEIFVHESKLEDFFGEKIETIFVSTIHKAKGREFDNVFILLDHFKVNNNEASRLLYVAMTRAKRCLMIHYNGNYLNFIKTEDLESIDDMGIYQPADQLALQLNFRDVWLDFFLSCQPLIADLYSGDVLYVEGDFCCNSNKRPVLRFSKQFLSQIESMKKSNYYPEKAKIRHIIYWKKENSEYEIRILLPEVYFKKIEE